MRTRSQTKNLNKNYSEACIYMLKHKTNDDLPFYVGSTINSLEEFKNHKKKYKTRKCNLKVYKYIREYGNGIHNWKIEIIEEYVCNESSDELNDIKLRKREKYWINFYNSINDGLNE